MRKLLGMLGLAVVCWLALPVGEVGAVPLFRATTTLDLGSMALATTGDLRLRWGTPVFDGWLLDGTGSYWYTGDELGASSEVGREDLRYYASTNYPPYYGYADSYVNLRLPFTVEGAGALSVTLPFHAEYDTGPYPDFDAYGSGPDFCHGTLMLVNGEEADWQAQNFRFDGFQIDRPDTYDYLMRGEDLWFAEGDAGYLNLFAYAESAVFYWQIPPAVDGQTPAPAPEPGTLLLLGGGLLAGGLIGRRRR